MKKIVFSALALTALAGAAQAQNTIEYRWVERHGQNSIGPGAVPVAGATAAGVGTPTDATIILTLEARVIGQGNALGISSFGGDVNSTDPFNPTRNTGGNTQGFLSTTSTQGGAPAGLHVNAAFANTNWAQSYAPYPDGDGGFLSTGRGIMNPFRQIANLGDNAQGVANDADGATAGLQNPANNVLQRLFGNMSFGDFGNNEDGPARLGLGSFIPLFVVRYDVTDLTARSLVISFNGFISAFSGYADGQPVVAVADTAVSASYTINIVPAPGAAALLGLGGLVAARRRRA
ncbi:MAG: hypothetical protein KF869_06310 [Phycisphaeraceae bacterium]|nr:hypothetical protein [Phycisphaeraceae bacterium]